MLDLNPVTELCQVANRLERKAAAAMEHDNLTSAAQLAAAAALYRVADALHSIADALTKPDA